MFGLTPRLIPLPYKLGALALLVALVGVSGYVKGRKDVRALWNAEKRSYELALAQAVGARQERERMWREAITVAGAKYDERAKMADQSFDASLDRLRNAYNSSARLRLPAAAAGSCPESSGPTAGELLKAGELVAGMVRDADRDRAALISCVQSYPR